MFTRAFLTVVFFALLFPNVSAAATKVGNGDDGSDLEGAVIIKSGPVFDARKKAVDRLISLNVRGIPGLGTLIPEVENTKLYQAKKDVTVKSVLDNSRFHSNLNGNVYARTFAEAHAETRFFPVSSTLDENQLIALHIHEGLHRALPIPVNEDEDVVSQLTLAITSPEATHDRVLATARSLIPELPSRYVPNLTSNSTAAPTYPTDDFKNPSSLGYEYRQFVNPNRPTEYRVDRMHVLYSYLYPFGGQGNPFGLGIGLSLIQGPGKHHMGPLNLSARMRVLSSRTFDVGLYGKAALNTLSDAELKNSPFGRDVFTVGISIARETPLFFLENSVGLSFGNDSTVKIGQINYHYDYGKVLEAKVKAGLKVYKFRLGGFVQLHLADFMKVNGGTFDYNSGRYRLLSVGPEISFITREYAFSLFGSALLDATKDANFDYLGNLLGPGASQGCVGASVSVYF